MYIYIYIYMRERERDPCMYIYIYIYTHTYTGKTPHTTFSRHPGESCSAVRSIAWPAECSGEDPKPRTIDVHSYICGIHIDARIHIYIYIYIYICTEGIHI